MIENENGKRNRVKGKKYDKQIDKVNATMHFQH